MAKKSKDEQTNGSASNEENSLPTPAAEVKPLSKKSAAKTSAKAAGKTAAKKAGAKAASKKSAVRRPVSAKEEPPEPSEADVRLRAYFIAERRVQLALQGDPSRDWIEARQQLLEEAAQKRAAK